MPAEMPCRPPHGSPDVEAALARLEEIGGFEVEVRREGQLYAVLRYRANEPECASMFVWETPRESVVCARKIAAFGEVRSEARNVAPETIRNEDRDERLGRSTKSMVERGTARVERD